MKRVYEVQTADGPFQFFAEFKTLAIDHARQLSDMQGFPKIESADIAKVKFIRWAEEGTL